MIFFSLSTTTLFTIYTATSYSLKALFKEVFKSVLSLRVPIIKAQGT